MKAICLIAAALAVTLLLGACGSSPEDKAHDDGKQVGQAVRQLFDSRSIGEAKAAATDLRNAVNGVGDEIRQSVRTQVATQRDTLAQAVQALKQGNLSEVKGEVQQIRAQADAFSHSNNSVANEFWRGFGDGYDS
jgi:ABC-type phosphate/phosphonate transport system substrate-binding protein